MCTPAIAYGAAKLVAGLTIGGASALAVRDIGRQLFKTDEPDMPTPAPMQPPSKAPQLGLNQAQQDTRNILKKRMGTRRLQIPLGAAGTSKLTINEQNEVMKRKKKANGLNTIT